MTDCSQQSNQSRITDRQADRRRHPRKSCFIPATWATSDAVLTDFIWNISAGGVFLDTTEPCLPGEQISMTFLLPNQKKPVKTTGEIVWKASVGVGIKFTSVSEDLEEMIEAL